MSSAPVNLPAVLAVVAIPNEVISSYSVGGVVLAIGLVTIFHRRDWLNARGLDKLILFGPLFYAAPLAAFGTEHFTLAAGMARMVPRWIPWHLFWVYFVGACFIAAALSIVTRIHTRLAASLLALTFFLFVVLMDIPGWARHPRDRFGLALALRELSFSAGPLALAASFTDEWRKHRTHLLATTARYFMTVTMLFYSLEQFMHGDHVPGVPLQRLTPQYIYGHAVWTYLAALAYAVTAIMLLLGKKTRMAAASAGLTVLFVELAVYVPMAVVDRASLVGLNYMGDTLMFCGTVLLLAGAMPRETSTSRPDEVALEHASTTRSPGYLS